MAKLSTLLIAVTILPNVGAIVKCISWYNETQYQCEGQFCYSNFIKINNSYVPFDQLCTDSVPIKGLPMGCYQQKLSYDLLPSGELISSVFCQCDTNYCNARLNSTPPFNNPSPVSLVSCDNHNGPQPTHSCNKMSLCLVSYFGVSNIYYQGTSNIFYDASQNSVRIGEAILKGGQGLIQTSKSQCRNFLT